MITNLRPRTSANCIAWAMPRNYRGAWADSRISQFRFPLFVFLPGVSLRSLWRSLRVAALRPASVGWLAAYSPWWLPLRLAKLPRPIQQLAVFIIGRQFLAGVVGAGLRLGSICWVWCVLVPR